MQESLFSNRNMSKKMPQQQPSTSYQSDDLYDDDYDPQLDDLFDYEEEEVVTQGSAPGGPPPPKHVCKGRTPHSRHLLAPFNADVKLSKKLASKKETVSNSS